LQSFKKKKKQHTVRLNSLYIGYVTAVYHRTS